MSDHYKEVSPSPEPADPAIERPNRRLAILYICLQTLFLSFTRLCVKQIFIAFPDLVNAQVLFARGFFSTLVAYCFVGTSVKEVVWTKVPQGEMSKILLRCSLGFVAKMLSYTILHHFTLTTAAVSQNLNPFGTVLLSVLILGESISCKDLSLILVSFSAILIIIYGAHLKGSTTSDPKNSVQYSREDHITLLPLMCLCINPLIGGFNNTLLRRLRKLDSKTISCYACPFSFLTAFLVCKYQGLDLGFFPKLFLNPYHVLMFAFIGSTAFI